MRTLRAITFAIAFLVSCHSALGQGQAGELRRGVERLEGPRILIEQIPGTITRVAAARELDTVELGALQARVEEAFDRYSEDRSGEAYRVLYAALAQALGRPWSERDELWRSLHLRSEARIADARGDATVWLAQLYPTDYEPTSPLRMTAKLLRGEREEQEIGTFGPLPGDLIAVPFPFSVDLRGLESGAYRVVAELSEGSEVLHSVSFEIRIVEDLESAREEVTHRLGKLAGFDSARATVLYPFDFAHQVNLGRREPKLFDFAKEIAASLALLDRLERGEDPLSGAKGTRKGHYFFEEAGEIMPYRLDVPEDYDPGRPTPLLVALHGNGGTEDTMMTALGGALKKATAAEGYIAVSPLGYRPTGGYGAEGNAGRPYSPQRRHLTRLSELDVMNVVEIVRREYNIDERRIYLLGGSMGGAGTWRIASRHPDIWAAIAPMCPGIMPAEVDFEGMRHIPVIVTHGDADVTVPVERSRRMVATMKEHGMVHEYHEIPGGGHMILGAGLEPSMAFLRRHIKEDSR